MLHFTKSYLIKTNKKGLISYYKNTACYNTPHRLSVKKWKNKKQYM